MKKRLPEPSSELEHVENFIDEIILPQKQVQLNSLFAVFHTIETLVKLQPQYSDVFRGVLNKKKRLSKLAGENHMTFYAEYDSQLEKIIEQLDEIEDLLAADLEKNIEKHDEVIADFLLLLSHQISALTINYVVINEMLSIYYEQY